MVRDNMEVEQPDSDQLEPRRLRMAPPPWCPGVDRMELPAIEVTTPSNDREDDFAVDEKDPLKERLVNGDTGRIGSYLMPSNSRLGSAEWVRLDLDDGRKVWLPGKEINTLVHSYAGTVHSAQGSEYKNVTMVVTPGGAQFLNQSMLMTGLSRARSHLLVWGDDLVLRRVAATPMPKRNSNLVERVELAMLAGPDEDEPNPATEPHEHEQVLYYLRIVYISQINMIASTNQAPTLCAAALSVEYDAALLSQAIEEIMPKIRAIESMAQARSDDLELMAAVPLSMSVAAAMSIASDKVNLLEMIEESGLFNAEDSMAMTQVKAMALEHAILEHASSKPAVSSDALAALRAKISGLGLARHSACDDSRL